MNKGNFGEFQSYKHLFLTPGKREFIHNCYLPVENGLSEIDLLMIHETGLYVIESKNFSGWIFGDEKQKEWTQILAGGKQKNRFYNPIWQNAGHINALREFFSDYKDVPIFSLVVFSERCELKKITLHSNNALVIKRDQLKSTFKKQIQGKSKCSSEMMKNIYQRLLPLCKMDDEVKQQHTDRINDLKYSSKGPIDDSETEGDSVEPVKGNNVNMIKAKVTEPGSFTTLGDKPQIMIEMPEKEDTIDKPGQCPRCNAALIERKGKNGPFIGCSGFPKCRYTSNI